MTSTISDHINGLTIDDFQKRIRQDNSLRMLYSPTVSATLFEASATDDGKSIQPANGTSFSQKDGLLAQLSRSIDKDYNEISNSKSFENLE